MVPFRTERMGWSAKLSSAPAKKPRTAYGVLAFQSERLLMGRKKLAQPTVLLVDDEEIDRSQVRSALVAEGYKILEAESYSDGMAVFDAHRNEVTVLLADVSLPDGNGCSLAIAMRAQKPDLRVLFISGHVGGEVCKYYGLDVDAVHFLRKPFEGPELAKRLRTILTETQGFPRLIAPKTSTSSGNQVR
jgi:DNA-binding response OmpR family regulator